jgi:hypothetical protein
MRRRGAGYQLSQRCRKLVHPAVAVEGLGEVRLDQGQRHKAYDTRDFVATLRALGVTPHVAQNTTNRRSAIDARTTRHPGYALSQRARKRVEEIFGWLKTVALLRQTRHRGRARVGWVFLFGFAAYNMLRIRNLTWAAA